MTYNPTFKVKKETMKQYKEKLCTADEAVKSIKSGDKITYGFFNGKPIDCDRALAARRDELTDIYIAGAVTVPPIPEVVTQDPDCKTFHYNDYHFSLLTRLMKMQHPGNIFYCPLIFAETDWECEHLSGPMYESDPEKCGTAVQDVHIMQVTPIDDNGFFNFGINNACMYGWCNAKNVIVEVNETMPVGLGGAREAIHISQVNHVVEGSNSPIYSLPEVEATEVEKKIAEHIFKYIHDGCCIQLGIGGTPNILGHMICESDLKHLGGHTEMLVDSFMEMYLSGRMDNSKKDIDRWKTVYTFALGSQKLYDWIHENKALASYNVGYANSFNNIRQIDNFMSINSAIEIDLNGQVNAESNGFQQVSGNGGMLDFVQGSFWSKGGKSFIALPSTYTLPDGQVISRVVPFFKPGTTVTIPRQMTQFLATEYGCVNLKLEPQWARAEKIISIAHPDFRDELIKAAEEQQIWRKSNKK